MPFDRGKLLELGGSYQLLTVNTTTGYDDRPVEGSLRLATNDTLSRFYLPTSGGYQRRGDRLLAGTYQGREAHRDTVVVQAHILSVGCQFWMCTDASPTQYRIEWVADDAFGGTWENYQSGIARAVDKQGHLLPNPSGHFCARRIGL